MVAALAVMSFTKTCYNTVYSPGTSGWASGFQGPKYAFQIGQWGAKLKWEREDCKLRPNRCCAEYFRRRCEQRLLRQLGF